MVSGSGSSTTRNASTGGHLALDGRGTVLVVRSALGALMPKRNGYEYPYDLATGGVGLHSALNRIARNRSPYIQNAYCRHAVIERMGMAKLTSTEVEASKAVTMLHRFYYGRSEEHTSELQSRLHLGCRLLL